MAPGHWAVPIPFAISSAYRQYALGRTQSGLGIFVASNEVLRAAHLPLEIPVAQAREPGHSANLATHAESQRRFCAEGGRPRLLGPSDRSGVVAGSLLCAANARRSSGEKCVRQAMRIAAAGERAESRTKSNRRRAPIVGARDPSRLAHQRAGDRPCVLWGARERPS